MAETRYTFTPGAPGDTPGLYVTCLTDERIKTTRWWDGARWWDIDLCGSRGAKAIPFKWPRGAAMRGISMPRYYKERGYDKTMRLRKITDQSKVRWGTAYKHFNEKEVLAYLVATATLPKDWRNCFQEEMRAAQAGKEGEKS